MRAIRLYPREVLVPFILIALFVLANTECGTNSQVNARRPQKNEVWIENGVFNPVEREIVSGMKVMWVNRDSAPHIITSGVTHFDGQFESGPIPPGGTFVHTFYKNGVYLYYCSTCPEIKQAAIVVGLNDNDLPIDWWR